MCPLSSNCVVVAEVLAVVVDVVVASSDDVCPAAEADEVLASSSLVSVSQLETVTGWRRRVRR